MKKGFTLIELMVVISIMGILSAVLFLAQSSEEKKTVLQMSAFEINQNLREVQEMSMGAGEFSCDIDEKAYTYGIHFDDTNTYSFFADCDDDHVFTSADVILKQIILSPEVIVYNLSPVSPLDIVFLPPEPVTYINAQETSVNGVITLSLENNYSIIKKIKVNAVGLIEIE